MPHRTNRSNSSGRFVFGDREPGLSESPWRGPHPTECDDLGVVPRIAVSLSGEQELCVPNQEDHREEKQKNDPYHYVPLTKPPKEKSMELT
jgi:hypothetical protein